MDASESSGISPGEGLSAHAIGVHSPSSELVESQEALTHPLDEFQSPPLPPQTSIFLDKI